VEQAHDFWSIFHLAAAAVGGALGWFFGVMDRVFYVLIAFVVADYITGVLIAIVQRKLSSEIGARGIAKKVAMFILIGIGHLIDAYIVQTGSALRMSLVFFYLVNEGLSILENCVTLGLPLPKKIRSVLNQLDLQGDAETDDKSVTKDTNLSIISAGAKLLQESASEESADEKTESR